jgi:Mrp family chromosome partitioning ATPase/capsular polysaccharide biosynthesis protein
MQQAAATLKVPVGQLETAAGKRLSVTVPASTLTTSNVLEISWQAGSPRLAEQGANAFANAYLSYRHQQLESQIATLQGTLQREDTSLRTEITALSAELNRARGTSYRVLNIRLSELTGEASTAQSQLSQLSTYNASGGKVIPAVLPTKPSGFARSLLTVIGLLLGLLVGLAVAFARDLFDDRLHGATQFEQQLDAPALAILPATHTTGERPVGRSSSRAQPSPAIMVVASPDSRAADAARMLRSSIVAMASRQDLRVLLVVAADASVSAGLIVAELGVALAESGRRVLLMASDLRGSLLPEIFDVPDNVGLSELLIKGGDPDVLTRRPRQASGAPLPAEVMGRLSVLPSGQRTMYALSVLDSSRMEEVLRGQREARDFVLLDAPPATTTDILPLAAHVDGVIVLAREAHTTGKDVAALRHRLQQLGVPIVGGVLVSKNGRGQRQPAQPRAAARRPAADRARSEQPAEPVRSRPAGSGPPPATRPMPVVSADVAHPSGPQGGTLKQSQ